MTTVSEWIDQDDRRRAPEFDFGTHWTHEHDPHVEWAVTYNTGTGELYARTIAGDDVDVLGQFAEPEDVADAIPDWGRREPQPGGLDWIRREVRNVAEFDQWNDVQSSADLRGGADLPDLHSGSDIEGAGDGVYAVVLATNGDTAALSTPQVPGDIAVRLDTADLEVARVVADDLAAERVVMWVDDRTHGRPLAVNATATRLYGTGWPILGDAVVATEDHRPLPPRLLDSLDVTGPGAGEFAGPNSAEVEQTGHEPDVPSPLALDVDDDWYDGADRRGDPTGSEHHRDADTNLDR